MAGRRRQDSWLVTQLPQLGLVISLLIFIFPWCVPGVMQFAPLFDLMLIYFWTLYRPSSCSYQCVFLYGILKDLVIGTMFGVSSLILILFKLLVGSQKRLLRNESFVIVWCGYIVASALIQFIHVALLLFIQSGSFSGEYPVIQWVISIAIYPLVHHLCYRINIWFPRTAAHA